MTIKNIKWSKEACKDLDSFQKNPNVIKRIEALIADIIDTPEVQQHLGIGKPELLKHDYTGCWSRRIDLKNRLIYRIHEEELFIVKCRGALQR